MAALGTRSGTWPVWSVGQVEAKFLAGAGFGRSYVFFIRREPGTGSSVVLVQTRALGGAGFLPGLGYVLARALG